MFVPHIYSSPPLHWERLLAIVYRSPSRVANLLRRCAVDLWHWSNALSFPARLKFWFCNFSTFWDFCDYFKFSLYLTYPKPAYLSSNRPKTHNKTSTKNNMSLSRQTSQMQHLYSLLIIKHQYILSIQHLYSWTSKLRNRHTNLHKSTVSRSRKGNLIVSHFSII